jgi:hypothetical protein
MVLPPLKPFHADHKHAFGKQLMPSGVPQTQTSFPSLTSTLTVLNIYKT